MTRHTIKSIASPISRVAFALTPLVFSGCQLLGGDEAYTPPPTQLTAVTAACGACTSASATHPCPERRVGGVICSGIPTIRAGETMLLCAVASASQGRNGRLEWSSNDRAVALVTPAGFTVTHCENEIGNATLQAVAPGTTTISVNEMEGSTILRTVSASVTVN